MIDSYYRTPFQKILIEPVVPHLLKSSMHANHLTFLALLSGIAVIPCLAVGKNIAALAFLLLSGYLDVLDGSVARRRKETSSYGALFDIVSDRIVEFSVVFGLYLVEPQSRGVLSLLMLGSILVCVTSFLVVGIFTANSGEKSFHYSPGIMERAEAFIFFALMISFPSFFGLLAPLFVLLVTLTAIVRIKEFVKKSSYTQTS